MAVVMLLAGAPDAPAAQRERQVAKHEAALAARLDLKYRRLTAREHAQHQAPGAMLTPVTVAPPPQPTPTPIPTPDVPPLPLGTGRAVQVRGFEFGLTLSRAEVLAGTVRVEYNLISAEDSHSLQLARADGTGPTYIFDEQPSGAVVAKSLALSAGTWDLVCTLPGHEEKGMRTTLVAR